MSGSSDGDARPRVVLITGEPGSGKTTLGTALARVLRVPFVARDDVRGGLFFSSGGWTERPVRVPTAEEGHDAFVQVVGALAGLGITCVVEYVVRTSRPEDLERIQAVADCVVLLTRCNDSSARRAARDLVDPLLQRRSVIDALGFADLDEHAARAAERMAEVAAEMRTDFDQPTLLVDTTDGYDPSLDDIITFVSTPPSCPLVAE